MRRLLFMLAMLMGLLVSVVPVSARQYGYYADLLDQSPHRYTTQRLLVRVFDGDTDGPPLPGMTVCSVWHFKTTDSRQICDDRRIWECHDELLH